MSVRHWNDDGSELRVPIIPESNFTDNITMAALVKVASKTGEHIFMAGRTAAGVPMWSFGIDADRKPKVFFGFTGGGFQTSTGPDGSEVPVDVWCVVAFTRNGLNIRRFHTMLLDGTSFHGYDELVGGSDPPGSTLGGHIVFGNMLGSDSLKGSMAVGGIWPSAMSDSHVESLIENLSSDDWAVNPFAAPSGAWNFNQEDPLDTVADMVGFHSVITGTIDSSTDNNGIDGTTIVTGSDPPGWNFSYTPPPLKMKLCLSGGASNLDATLSIGGPKSAAAVTPTLFDDVGDSQRTAGMIDYRLVYCQNNEEADITVQAVVSEQLEAGRQLAVGAATQAAGVEVPAIANDTAAPAGVTFQASASVNLGAIPPGLAKGMWVRRTIDPATPEDSSNPCEISLTVNLV